MALTDRTARVTGNMSQGIALFDAQGRMQLFNQCYADWSEAPPCALHARVALQSLGDFQKQRGDFGADCASLGESCYRPLGGGVRRKRPGLLDFPDPLGGLV